MVEIPGAPLMGEQQFNDLKAGYDAIKWSLAEIAKAKRAGINVDAQEVAAKDAKARIENIMMVYYPNRQY